MKMSKKKSKSMNRLMRKRMVTHAPSSMNVTSYGVTMAVYRSDDSITTSQIGMNFDRRGSITLLPLYTLASIFRSPRVISGILAPMRAFALSLLRMRVCCCSRVSSAAPSVMNSVPLRTSVDGFLPPPC